MTATTTTFASRLRSLREERGWTQTELAERVGIDQGDLSRYEAGKRLPSLARAAEFARALDVSLGELVEG